MQEQRTPAERGKSGAARWLVSTAIGDRTMYDGSPLMYHDAESNEPTRPIREDIGRCAVVEAATPQEAAQRAIEWLAAEYPGDMTCGECERPHTVGGVVVLPYDPETLTRFESETIWRASDA